MNKNDFISPKEALKVLDTHLEGRKKRVHTFQVFGPAIFGCDMDLTTIKKFFKDAKEDELVISGPNMLNMKHGIALFREGEGWLFIATQSWFKMAVIN